MTDKKNKKVNKGCLFGCVGFPAIAAILIAIFIPSFTDMMPKAVTSGIKNNLTKIVKKCFLRSNEGLSTGFSDVQDLIDEYINSFGPNFDIDQLNSDDCFNLIAYPPYSYNEKLTWFSINIDPESGLIRRNCGDSSKIGCMKGNAW